MIKAAFFDIDGTLVSISSHKIPTSTIEALVALKKQRIKIIIATERYFSSINNLTQLQQLDLIDGYITMNGSYCFVGDKLLYKNSIPKTDCEEIINFCEQKNCTCVAVGETKVAVFNPTEAFTHMFYDELHVKKIPEVTKEEILSFETYQLSPFITKEDEMEIIDNIPNCEINRWIEDFTDIGAKGNTKQLGMDKMLDHFDIDLSETIAFGDGGNDISMLKHAAIGVAMGNAYLHVKDVANYTTLNVDEGGIDYALRHFGII